MRHGLCIIIVFVALVVQWSDGATNIGNANATETNTKTLRASACVCVCCWSKKVKRGKLLFLSFLSHSNLTSHSFMLSSLAYTRLQQCKSIIHLLCVVCFTLCSITQWSMSNVKTKPTRITTPAGCRRQRSTTTTTVAWRHRKCLFQCFPMNM